MSAAFSVLRGWISARDAALDLAREQGSIRSNAVNNKTHQLRVEMTPDLRA